MGRALGLAATPASPGDPGNGDEDGKRLDAADVKSLGAKAPLTGYDRDKLAKLLTKWLPTTKPQ